MLQQPELILSTYAYLVCLCRTWTVLAVRGEEGSLVPPTAVQCSDVRTTNKTVAGASARRQRQTKQAQRIAPMTVHSSNISKMRDVTSLVASAGFPTLQEEVIRLLGMPRFTSTACASTRRVRTAWRWSIGSHRRGTVSPTRQATERLLRRPRSAGVSTRLGSATSRTRRERTRRWAGTEAPVVCWLYRVSWIT